jgi:hypothetical protein
MQCILGFKEDLHFKRRNRRRRDDLKCSG